MTWVHGDGCSTRYKVCDCGGWKCASLPLIRPKTKEGSVRNTVAPRLLAHRPQPQPPTGRARSAPHRICPHAARSDWICAHETPWTARDRLVRARKMLPCGVGTLRTFEAIWHPLSARIPHKHAASASMQSHSAVQGVHAALLANCFAAHPIATFALPPAPPAAAQVISRPQEKKSSPE